MLKDNEIEMKRKIARVRPVIFQDSFDGRYTFDVSENDAKWQSIDEISTNSDVVRFNTFETISPSQNPRFSNEEWNQKLNEVAEKYNAILEKLSK